MMKKVLLMLLCLLLVLPAAQAKTFSYTIPELIERQLDSGGTSLRVKLTAAAQGEAIAPVDAQTWALLQNMLPQLEIGGTYFKSKSGGASGDQQVKGSLLKAEETLTAFTLTGRGDKWFLESDLLPGKVYSLSRDMKDAFMNATAPQEGEWPHILRLLNAVVSTDESFAAALDGAMNEHMASLNRWLQGYTQVEFTSGQLLQHIAVPAADMKQQMKDFLAELYADEALLDLLRSTAPQADAQVYLESGMLPLFCQAIDQLELAGDVVISRAYDAKGDLESEEITLPFGGGMPVSSLTLAHGKKTALKVTNAQGGVFALSFEGGVKAVTGVYEGTYAGEILWQRAGDEKAFEALFTLKASRGMEQYIEENKSRERDQKLTAELVITPADGESFSDQKLTAEVHLTAGASNTKPAYANTVLVWQDVKTGGALEIHLDINTSAGLRHSEVDEALAVQVDTADAADRSELLADMTGQFSEQLAVLLDKIMPDVNAP